MIHPFEINTRGKLVDKDTMSLLSFKKALQALSRYTLKSRRMYMSQEDYDDITAFK